MRVLFTTLRNTSHFLPLVPFIEACQRRGHEVAVAAPLDLAERVAKTGAPFFPFGHPGDAGLKPIWARLPTVPPEEAKRIVIQEIFAGITVTEALPELQKTIDTFRPQLIVRESQEYAAVVAAEKAGIPCARVAISLSGGELGIFALAAPAVDVHRERLGLPLDPSGDRIASAPALTLLPASLEDPDALGTASIRRFRTLNRASAPLPEWWGADTRPLLYVTLGTVAGGMENARGAYRTVLEAVGTLPLRVLFTTGSDFPPDALGPAPENVRVERFVPQDDVFPHASATVCHGGSGTMLGALAAGVPMVVTPLFADQPYNAERVAKVGAGLVLDGRSLSVDALRAAVSRVIAEDSFRVAAERVKVEIAGLPLVDDAALAMEQMARG